MDDPRTSNDISVEPMDEHNRALVGLVHRPGWVNPTPSGVYDMVVIGAGPAGLVTAMGAAALKNKVALIERHLMGGDCLNVGCVPSKALLRCARAAAEVRDAGRFGVKVPPGVEVDFPAVMARMRRLRASLAQHDSVQRYTDAGVDVYLGHARFTGPATVEVAGQTLAFHKACIATGSRPAIPSIPGLEEVGYLTNESVFSLTELPRRLAVIGAGPVGCELAQAFARFGSEVVLIEGGHGVLPSEDPDAAELIRRSLERDGVRVLCCSREIRFEARPDGRHVLLESHGQRAELPFDRLLVATGRKPNVEDMGLDAAGVKTGLWGVAVDTCLRTTNPRIYAAGDVCSGWRFTHWADAQARAVVRNALVLPCSRLLKAFGRTEWLPRCVYTEPELAQVGMNQRAATSSGKWVESIRIDLGRVDRAVLDDAAEGFMKIYIGRGRGDIRGATIVGAHAGELASHIATAMTHGVRLRDLSRVVFPYPTQAEAVKKAADAAYKDWLLRWRDRLGWLVGRG